MLIIKELLWGLTRYGKLSAKSEREQSQVSEDAVAYHPAPTQTDYLSIAFPYDWN